MGRALLFKTISRKDFEQLPENIKENNNYIIIDINNSKSYYIGGLIMEDNI